MAKNKNEETGVILKIQKQTGCLLFVIGAAMLAFVLTDFFKSGSSMFGGSENVVGEIAGEEVDYNELMREVDELKVIYQGSNFDDASLAEQAWNKMIQERIIKVEHDKLGLKTSTAELEDAYFGPDPDPMVIRNFTDPNTKQFDRNMLRQFMEIDMQEDPEKYKNFLNFLENPLKEFREGAKYEAMVKAGLYNTSIDAKYEFDREEYRAGAKAVGLPYSTIPDSSITFDDGDLEAYLSEHKEDYQQLASRDIKYVSLNVFPSAQDTLDTKKEIEKKKERFKTTKDDSSYVTNRYTLIKYSSNYFRRGETRIDPAIEAQLFNLDSGEMTNVLYSKGTFGLYKVTGTGEDSLSVMRARHVLIPMGDDAESEANTILADIRSGKVTFEEKAKENYDGTGNTGGDLGWFQKTGFNTQVPEEVREKVFSSAVGSYFVMKSPRGYHVVNVTGGPSTKTIQFAALVKQVTPGTESFKEVQRQAGKIYYQADESGDFEGTLEEFGKSPRVANKILVDNPVIPGINDSKTIVRWLYDDERKVGDVSEVFTLSEPDRYIVAQCAAIREKGTPKLDDNREQITSDYVRDMKGEKLVEKMKEALSSASDADALASSINSTVQIVPAVNLNSGQATGVGAEPEVIGTILGLDKDQRSQPIKGISGVYVVWGTGQVTIGEAQDYKADEMREMLDDRAKQTVSDAVINALREKGNIVDKRYKYF